MAKAAAVGTPAQASTAAAAADASARSAAVGAAQTQRNGARSGARVRAVRSTGVTDHYWPIYCPFSIVVVVVDVDC